MKCSYNRIHLSEMWQTGQQYREVYSRKLEMEEKKLSGWEAALMDRALSKEDEATLMKCEMILPINTILLWRSVVEVGVEKTLNGSRSAPPWKCSRLFGSNSGRFSLQAATNRFPLRPTSCYILVFCVLPSVRFLHSTEVEALNPEMLPPNYVKTMVRVSLHEVKFRLVADRLSAGTAKRRRESEKVLCCLFMNGMTFTLQTGYGWWEVSCGVTNLALKDYTNVRDKMRYIIRRNDVDYDKDESQTFFDKKDMIQVKLKYGENLFFYGNLNYLDVYLNVPSILKIASFFDLHKEKVAAPKEPANRSIRDVPKLFTIMTYLYTVHPSLTVTNFHVYLPANASDLDTPLTILSVPRIELRGTTSILLFMCRQ